MQSVMQLMGPAYRRPLNEMMSWPLGVLALLCAAAAAQAEPVRQGPWPLAKTVGPKVEILAYDHGDVSPWSEFFTFDSAKHPKIVQLRTEYQLDELTKPAKTDIERAAVLMKWVAGALKFGTPAPDVFSDWSTVALLVRAKQGQVVWCGQAAMVFQQACLAVGLPARFIELGIPQTPACHFTTEVFLREPGKWAVVDATPLPEFKVYYTVDGVPQSALDMHRHVVNGTMEKVVEVHPDRSHKVEKKDSPAWTFYYVRWLTRCDVVTNTPKYIDLEHVFDKRWHTVEWSDEKTIPWEKQKHAAWYLQRASGSLEHLRSRRDRLAADGASEDPALPGRGEVALRPALERGRRVRPLPGAVQRGRLGRCPQDKHPRRVGQVPRLGPGPVLGRGQAGALQRPSARRPPRRIDRSGQLREVPRGVTAAPQESRSRRATWLSPGLRLLAWE